MNFNVSTWTLILAYNKAPAQYFSNGTFFPIATEQQFCVCVYSEVEPIYTP